MRIPKNPNGNNVGAAGNDVLWGKALVLTDGRYDNSSDIDFSVPCGFDGNDNISGGIYYNDNDFCEGDEIFGGNGNDTIYGDCGPDEPGWDNSANGSSDVLSGQGGNDRLIGGGEAELLYGGAGADRFIFTNLSDSHSGGARRDMIEDFRVTQGDRIDLHLIDANTRLSGNQAFRFLGTDDFTGRAGRLKSIASRAICF